MPPPIEIRPDKPVRHRFRPGLVGVMTGQTIDGITLFVEVRWADDTSFEPIEALEDFTALRDESFEELVSRGRYEGVESMRSLLTFEKLRGDLSNVVYSMRTAEIDFYPHQFLPVLKFVNSPLGRLLIADEVGLGKTIEAALIWTECQARFKSRRLLVVCPPTLIPKWIRELRERFDIPAEAADASSLLDHFDRFERRGAGHGFALVCSYHSLRPFRTERQLLRPWLAGSGGPRFREDLPELSAMPPRAALLRRLIEWDSKHAFLDLVVFDEAHLMKKTETANHVVGDVLSSSAQNVLALSATPLTTSTRDLYSLLKLVDPDMFRDQATFDAMRSRNQAAVLLGNALMKPRVDRKECISLLEQVPDSTAKTHLQGRLKTLSDADLQSPVERIELAGKCQRLNELGAFLNRTRKVEVVRDRVVRDPVTLNVRPTEEESLLYNAMLRLIRNHVAERGDALSIFHLIGPALTMTSCLPVMADKLRRGKLRWGDLDDLRSLETAYTEEESSLDFVGEQVDLAWPDLGRVAEYDFEAADTKYSALRDELFKRIQSDKVIIFAFFKETLRYLQQRLEADGISTLLVTGDTTDLEERDRLLRSFKEAGRQVLLCSEVAAEGVDLQFCRVMVNYDLPWNPMRVEQRIGRIDRIGQTASTIVIVNFHVHGTIDGSIYAHLHKNIGLFTNTVGSLEGIIGEHLNRLTQSLLEDDLTPQMMEQRIIATSLAIENERVIEGTVNSESDSLLGLRSVLQNSITQGQSLGRYLKPEELQRYAREFFAESYTEQEICQYGEDTPADGCLTLYLSFPAFSDFERFTELHQLPWPKGFSRRDRRAVLTFDPDVHNRLKGEHPRLVLVNHLHPMMQWIVTRRREARRRWHPASATVLSSTEFEPGIYLYLVMRSSISHPAMSRNELLFRCHHVEKSTALDPERSESLVNSVAGSAVSWASTSGYPDLSDEFGRLAGLAAADFRRKQEEFGEELELRLNTRRAQITNHFENRIMNARKRLLSMRERAETRGQGIRLVEAQIESLQSRLAEEINLVAENIPIQASCGRLACGIVKVTP